MRDAITVRPATAREFTTVWNLVVGLAVYERRRRHVRSTPAVLRRHGSGRRPYFRALICRRGAEPIGVAIYLMTYSTFAGRPTLYIEDIFVLPEARGEGAGLALMRALARTAARAGCRRMAWSVLRWNRPAIDFYRRLGAETVTAWISMELGMGALTRLASSGAERARRLRRPRSRRLAAAARIAGRRPRGGAHALG